MAKSKLGYIQLNTKTVSDFWADPSLVFTTTTFGKHIPILISKLGADVKLTGYIHFKDIEVLFGSFDTDVILSYKVGIQLNAEVGGSSHSTLDYDNAKHQASSHDKSKIVEVIYDELDMVTSAKVTSENDMVYVNLLKHKLFIDSQTHIKKAPIRNGM